MGNNYREIVKARRNNVALLFAKSVTKPECIALELNENIDVIYKDILYLKQQTQSWLNDLAFDGFIWEYKNAIDKLKDIELDLQKMRQETTNVDEKIKIIRALEYNINLQLETLAEGPTLIALKRALENRLR